MNSAPDIFQKLLRRICPDYAGRITGTLTPGTGDGFRLSAAPDGGIAIAGEKPLALAAGLNHYLKTRCGAHLSWCGNRLDLPSEPPALNAEEIHRFPLPLRPYFNYCTFGYSTVWWDWRRWEQEIEFMALNGVNMPLAVTGMEAVWLRTFLRFGLSRGEVLEFLSGPAFLPWQYMNNLNGHAGPLPELWIESHLELGRRIAEHERAWGMEPILPGYNGHVPEAFVRRYPGVNYFRSEGWCHFAPVSSVDPSEPVFYEIFEAFMEELKQAFPAGPYYGIDLFHEQRIGECSPDDLARCGEGVAKALLKADPDAVWVMQAWSERPEIIDAVPQGHLLMLDIGKERLKATDGLSGVPTVWGTIHSFGGQTEIGGDLAAIPQEIKEQRRNYSNLVGAGAFPESICNNPVLFELVFDSALRGGEVELEPWIMDYAQRRYGVLTENLREAWRLLLKNVYTERRGDPVFAARPALELDRANAWAGFNRADVPARFFPAWGKLLDAAAEAGSAEGYRFDLIDLGRQALSSLGLPFHTACAEAFRNRDAAGFRRAADRFLELLRDCDTLLGCREEFRFDRWLSDARKWGRTPAEQDYYEWNARLQLTLWGPVSRPEPLFDYCCREWNGLTLEYHGTRWSMFFDFLAELLEQNLPYDESSLPRLEGRILLDANEFYRKLYAFEQAFVRRTSRMVPPERILPDPVATARGMFLKYRGPAENAGVPASGSGDKKSEVLAGFSGDGAVTL